MIDAPVFSSIDGKIVYEQEINKDIFDIPYKPLVLKLVIDWQLSKRRAGTHSTKTISQVSGTTAKPYKQKGSGRARQGSLRSPHFRGGAVIFGPVVRSHAYQINKKVRRLALKIALSHKARNKQLFFVDDLSKFSSKTRDLNNILCKICSKSILVIDDMISDNIKKASGNLNNVDTLPIVGLNAYDIMRHHCIIINLQSIQKLEERVL